MKECKFDNKLLEKIDASQRITRALFFKGIIITSWLFFTKLLIDAFLIIAKYLYDTVDEVWWGDINHIPVQAESPTYILIILCAIVLLTYTYVLCKLWSFVNNAYEIESFW
jgi:hypothetical protein